MASTSDSEERSRDLSLGGPVRHTDSREAPEDLIGRVPIPKGRVGFVTLGHEPYWSQFPGLKEQLQQNGRILVERLRACGVDVVDAGLIDTSARGMEAGDALRTRDVDLLFCYVATYATSAVAFPAVRRSGAGAVLLGLQPSSGMRYETATTYDQLLHDNVTSLPEISGALMRAGSRPLDIIVGTLYDDPRSQERIAQWCRVATTLRAVRNSRIGYLGHTYEGMLDMHSDPTMFHAHFGLHVEMLEMCDLQDQVDRVTDDQVERMVANIRSIFHFADPGMDPIAGPVKEEELTWAARVAIALEHLVDAHRLTALAYYYRGLGGNAYERLAAAMIVGSSLMTGRGVPIAGEADLKTCIAMLIMDRLGAGGSFAEFHPVDFEDDIALVGHDGPAHIQISDQRPILRGLSLYHGKRGSGVSVEFKIKTGPVTLLGLTQTSDGRFKFVVGRGESISGPIPKTGNTNTRVRFPCDIGTFVEKWSLEGPTHHFALGVGDQVETICKVGRALGIETKVVQ